MIFGCPDMNQTLQTVLLTCHKSKEFDVNLFRPSGCYGLSVTEHLNTQASVCVSRVSGDVSSATAKSQLRVAHHPWHNPHTSTNS